MTRDQVRRIVHAATEDWRKATAAALEHYRKAMYAAQAQCPHDWQQHNDVSAYPGDIVGHTEWRCEICKVVTDKNPTKKKARKQ